jgi:ATP phosphoribosyltransferase
VLQPPTATTGVEEIMDLGFGRCKLQVQVPEMGSIENPEQLVGKNVVTSFANLSKKYFTDLEATADGIKVVNGMSTLRTNIKYIGGSVEAACALGIADGIVDLVGKNCLLAVAE